MSLSAAIGGDLHTWRGLSGTETRQVVAVSLAPLVRMDEENRIRKSRQFAVVTYEREVKPSLVHGWYLVSDPHLFLLEYGDPELRPFDDLENGLGTPDLVLPSHRNGPAGLVHEYVYARRGLTLALAESTTEGDRQRTVIYVQLYRPMEPQFYVVDIGALEGPRPYPRSVNFDTRRGAFHDCSVSV